MIFCIGDSLTPAIQFLRPYFSIFVRQYFLRGIAVLTDISSNIPPLPSDPSACSSLPSATLSPFVSEGIASEIEVIWIYIDYFTYFQQVLCQNFGSLFTLLRYILAMRKRDEREGDGRFSFEWTPSLWGNMRSIHDLTRWHLYLEFFHYFFQISYSDLQGIFKIYIKYELI